MGSYELTLLCPLCSDAVVESLQNVHLWFTVLTKNLGPLVSFTATAAPALADIPAPPPLIPLNPPNMRMHTLIKALRVCLMDEHHLALQASLNFMYALRLARRAW